MTIATTPTLLSLDRWAKIIGLNPVHFSGAAGGHFWMQTTECKDVWAQYPWQTPAQLVSREEIAFEIAKAEREIKEILGYSPAPDWEWRENHTWPGGNRYQAKNIALNYGKIIAPGLRAATLIKDGAEVSFSDPDLDGWDELATVIVNTDVIDRREIKLFFVDQNGLPEWEIRPLRDVKIEAGVATITLDAWLLIDPSLWFEYPNDSENYGEPIAVNNTENFADVVDVYRIFNDTAADGASILVGNASNTVFCYGCTNGLCPVCGATVQGGTFSIMSAESPIISPYPASYDDATWRVEPWANCGVPRLTAINYYAGEVDKRYATGQSLDPLSDFWADAIAWMAVARLPRGVCGCDNIRQRIDAMQKDLTRNDQNEAFARSEKMDLWRSAFGTRAGEFRAWQACTRIVGDQVMAGGAL